MSNNDENIRRRARCSIERMSTDALLYCDLKCSTLISQRPWVSHLQTWPQVLTSLWMAETNFPSRESKDCRRRSNKGFSDIWKFNRWTPWPCGYWISDIQILWSPVKYTCQPVMPVSLWEQGLHFSSEDRQRVRNHKKWKVPRIENSHKTYIPLQGRKYVLNMCIIT